MHKLVYQLLEVCTVVETGEKIIREEILEGAILTRVASSHIRMELFNMLYLKRKKFENFIRLYN